MGELPPYITLGARPWEYARQASLWGKRSGGAAAVKHMVAKFRSVDLFEMLNAVTMDVFHAACRSQSTRSELGEINLLKHFT